MYKKTASLQASPRAEVVSVDVQWKTMKQVVASVCRRATQMWSYLSDLKGQQPQDKKFLEGLVFRELGEGKGIFCAVFPAVVSKGKSRLFAAADL